MAKQKLWRTRVPKAILGSVNGGLGGGVLRNGGQGSDTDRLDFVLKILWNSGFQDFGKKAFKKLNSQFCKTIEAVLKVWSVDRPEENMNRVENGFPDVGFWDIHSTGLQVGGAVIGNLWVIATFGIRSCAYSSSDVREPWELIHDL